MAKYERGHACGADGNLHTATENPWLNLALAVVYSGVASYDLDFLLGDWCATLLNAIGCKLDGPELLAAYAMNRGDVNNGKR